MVVLGGSGSLFGPVLGTAVFVIAEEYLTPMMNLFAAGSGVYWHIVFGPFLVLVVLFGRRGIDGLLDDRGHRDD
jgi:branched-chain amino acid transport system permease protein